MRRKYLFLHIVICSICLLVTSCSKEDELRSYINVINNVEVSYEGGLLKVDVGSNIDWSISSTYDWIKISNSSYAGNSVLEINIEPAVSHDIRTAELLLESVDKSVSKNLVISQAGIPYPNYFGTPYMDGAAKISQEFNGELVIPYSGIENEISIVLNVTPTGEAFRGFNTVSGFQVNVNNEGEIRIPISGTPVKSGNVDFNITGLPGVENLVCNFIVSDIYILKGIIKPNGGKPAPSKNMPFDTNGYGRENSDPSTYGLPGWSTTLTGKAQEAIVVGKKAQKGTVRTPQLSAITETSDIIVSFYAYTFLDPKNPVTTVTVNLYNSTDEIKDAKSVTIDVGGSATVDGKNVFADDMKEFKVEFEGVENTDKLEFSVNNAVFLKDFYVMYK